MRTAQHVRQGTGGARLRVAGEVGDQADHVTARIPGGEIRPLPGAQVHLEGAGAAVVAARVPRDIFRTHGPTIGQPAAQQRRQDGQGGTADGVEIHPIHGYVPLWQVARMVLASIHASRSARR